MQLAALAGGLEGWTPLVVLPEEGPLAGLLRDAGVEVVVHPLAVLRRRTLSPAGLARLAVALARDRKFLSDLCAERDAALVHSNTSVILVRPRNVPHVIHVREIYSGAVGRGAGMAWGPLRRRLLRADALVCVSHAVERQFPSGACVVVHDGLTRIPSPVPRAEARAALGIDPDATVIALLGRIADWKGQDVLARALARSELTDDIETVGLIAGDGYGDPAPERELAALRDHLGLGARLVTPGFVDADQALGAADLVAVPSTRPDPLPNSALEAAAAGLPVVAASHGGLPEIVVDGETGLLVPPGDPAALARALRSLADDPERARRMGEAAAADVRERFGTPRMLAAVQALYEQLSPTPQ